MYLKYQVKSNRRTLIMLTAVLFLMIPFYLFITKEQFDSYYAGDQSSNALKALIECSTVCGFILAFVVPIYQFRFLYKKQMNDLYLSLPMKRSKLFLVQYLYGLAAWIIPLIINFLLGYLVVWFCTDINAISISTLRYEVWLMFLILLITLTVQYTVVTFFSIKCNHMLDSILINGLYVILPVLFYGALNTFLGNQTAELLEIRAWDSFAFQTEIIKFLSLPMYYLTSVLYSLETTLLVNGVAVQLQFTSMSFGILMYWILLGLGIFYLSRKAFIQKKEELCEQRTEVWMTYPFIILSGTFLLILVAINSDWSQMLIAMVFIFIAYCGILFFSQRKIKLKIKDMIIFIALFGVAYGAGFVFQNTSGFGLVEEYPSATKVEYANVSMFGDLVEILGETYDEETMYEHSNLCGKTEKEISDIVALQKLVKQNSVDLEDEDTVGFNFFYTMKDGNEKSRDYIIKVTDENKQQIMQLLESQVQNQ